MGLSHHQPLLSLFPFTSTDCCGWIILFFPTTKPYYAQSAAAAIARLVTLEVSALPSAISPASFMLS